MTTTELLAKLKDVRDQKGRMYDSELQILLSHVVSHLEENEAGVDLVATPRRPTKSAKRASSFRPKVKFAKGDRARVVAACPVAEYRGQACVVRRVFWDAGLGGHPPGWVCETDIPFGADQYRGFWEDLLEPANV